jgi:hypothetical protein
LIPLDDACDDSCVRKLHEFALNRPRSELQSANDLSQVEALIAVAEEDAEHCLSRRSEERRSD